MATAASRAAKPPGGVEFTFPDEAGDDAILETEDEVKAAVEGAEDDITIDIVDDTPAEDRGFTTGSGHIPEVSDAELESYAGDVQKRIKALSFARHDERRGKEQATREKQELERLVHSTIAENKRLKSYVHNGEQVYAGTAKTAAEAKMEIARRKFKEAHDVFDSEAIAVAQQEMTVAQLDLISATNFRPTPLQAEDDGVYRQASEQAAPPDERAERWKQKNAWFGSNNPMTAYALALHQDLVSSGIDPRSDDYYARLNADIRQTFPKQFGNPAPANEPTRKPANVVAPSTRSSGAKKVTLTQTQITLARRLGITPEQYAKQVVLDAALLESTNGR